MENSSNFNERISYQKEFEENHKKELLAKKLLKDKSLVDKLDNNQVDDMIEYFQKDIERQDAELARIKKHILQMKKELEKNTQNKKKRK